MRFKSLVQLTVADWRASYIDLGQRQETALMVLGPPGIGKTSTAREMAREMTAIMRQKNAAAPEAVCEILDLSSRLPEDIGGLPFRDKLGDTDVTIYAVQSWLARLCQPGVYGVLCLDDLPAAAPAVQVAVRQLVLDRKVGDTKLADGIVIMVTGNRREDKAGASTLPAHFRNSVCIVGVDADVEEWCEWYGKQKNHAPVIAAFLRFRPSHHSKLPKEADKAGAFATPRTWTKLGRLMAVATDTGNFLEVAGGLVGEGVATEFQAFINVRNQLVDPAKVLKDPVGTLPNPKQTLNSPDRAYAMTTGLGEVAAAWRTGNDDKKKKEAPLLFLRAVGHITQRDREYISVAVSTYTSNGGDINSLVQSARNHMSDPLVKSVIDFLAKTFSGGR